MSDYLDSIFQEDNLIKAHGIFTQIPIIKIGDVLCSFLKMENEEAVDPDGSDEKLNVTVCQLSSKIKDGLYNVTISNKVGNLKRNPEIAQYD